MKPLLFTLIVTALLASPILAQDQPKRPGGRMGPEERLKVMTEKLTLTAEQQEKVKAVFEKYGPQIKEIMSKGRENLTEQDRSKMQELMKSQNEEINGILTPEQQAKWKEMHQQGPGGDKGGKRRPGKEKSN